MLDGGPEEEEYVVTGTDEVFRVVEKQVGLFVALFFSVK